jgi:hypothetical protein
VTRFSWFATNDDVMMFKSIDLLRYLVVTFDFVNSVHSAVQVEKRQYLLYCSLTEIHALTKIYA